MNGQGEQLATTYHHQYSMIFWYSPTSCTSVLRRVSLLLLAITTPSRTNESMFLNGKFAYPAKDPFFPTGMLLHMYTFNVSGPPTLSVDLNASSTVLSAQLSAHSRHTVRVIPASRNTKGARDLANDTFRNRKCS